MSISNKNNKNNKNLNQNLQPNYQISGIEPNYSYRGVQNIPFDQSSIASSGYSSNEGLSRAAEQQQQFVNNYNNYKPISTFDRADTNSSHLENQINFSQYSIQKGFKSNEPIMFMPDTRNNHETLYDNLNDNLLKESLKEYRLNIDSIDRNVMLYPDPFNYVVHLGPVTNSGINSTVAKTDIKTDLKTELRNLSKKNKGIKNTSKNEFVDSGSVEILSNSIFVFDNPEAIKEYTISLERSFNPYIIRDFVNVSYVKLDCAVIPKFRTVCINRDWDFCRKKHHKKNFYKDEYDRIKDYIILNDRYIPNEKDEYNPLGDRFVQIYIQELQSIRNFGTNAITDKSFVLIFDKILGALYLKLIPYSATKTYKDSLLGNLTKLSIQFYDSWGKPLTINTEPIDYEKNQLLNTKIINPEKYNIENLLEEDINQPDTKDKFIEHFNEIIKCFIIINYNIGLIIPFYTQNNLSENIVKKINFHEDCEDYKTIYLNEKIFEVKDLYEELNSFVCPDSPSGFRERIKISKSDKKIKLSIDEYINNVIWFDFNKENKNKIISNIRAFDFNYRNFGFKILDTLKTEIVNLPVNKNFQNFLTFLVGVWEDELNTKINYYT